LFAKKKLVIVEIYWYFSLIQVKVVGERRELRIFMGEGFYA